MSKYETVLVERHGAVAVVSLNRPDKLNSFNGPLRRDLLLAVREVNDDDSVRVVVLTGAGRAFSAGADLADMPDDKTSFRVEDQLNGEYKPALMEIHEASKPWISAVNGATSRGTTITLPGGSAACEVCQNERRSGFASPLGSTTKTRSSSAASANPPAWRM